MNPFDGLIKKVWSLILLLLLTAVAFSVLRGAIGQRGGTDFMIGVALLGFVFWRLAAGPKRLLGKKGAGRTERPELPTRARWITSRKRDGRRQW